MIGKHSKTMAWAMGATLAIGAGDALAALDPPLPDGYVAISPDDPRHERALALLEPFAEAPVDRNIWRLAVPAASGDEIPHVAYIGTVDEQPSAKDFYYELSSMRAGFARVGEAFAAHTERTGLDHAAQIEALATGELSITEIEKNILVPLRLRVHAPTSYALKGVSRVSGGNAATALTMTRTLPGGERVISVWAAQTFSLEPAVWDAADRYLHQLDPIEIPDPGAAVKPLMAALKALFPGAGQCRELPFGPQRTEWKCESDGGFGIYGFLQLAGPAEDREVSKLVLQFPRRHRVHAIGFILDVLYPIHAEDLKYHFAANGAMGEGMQLRSKQTEYGIGEGVIEVVTPCAILTESCFILLFDRR